MTKYTFGNRGETIHDGKRAKQILGANRYGSRVMAMVEWLQDNGYTVDEVKESATTESFYLTIRRYRGRIIRTIRLSDHFNGVDTLITAFFTLKKPIAWYKEGYDPRRIEQLFS